jgi:hypothetical protein
MAERKSNAWWLLLLGVGGVALLGTSGNAFASSSPRPSLDPPKPPRPTVPPDILEASPPVYETDNRVALGRVITSEAAPHTLAERSAVAWACRNMARRRKLTIAQLVCSPCGKQAGWPRPFSSAQPAREADLRLAAVVLDSPQNLDVTDGATNCFMPDLLDQLHAAGRAKYSADEVRKRWTTSFKLERYGRVGRWELYGPQRTTRTAPASPAAATGARAP